MTNKEIEEKVDLMCMTYDGNGKLTKFQDDIYGFVDMTSRVELIDIVNNKLFKKYSLKYLGENIIIQYNYTWKFLFIYSKYSKYCVRINTLKQKNI